MKRLFLWIVLTLGFNIFSFKPSDNDQLWNTIQHYLIKRKLANKVYTLFIKYVKKTNTVEIIINTSYLNVFNSKLQNELELDIIDYINKCPIKNGIINSKKNTFKISLIVNDFRLHSENLKELFV